MLIQEMNTYIKMYARYIWVFILFFILTGSESCEKFIDVPPPSTSITGESVFDDNETAIAALTSIYSQISSNSFRSYLAPTTSIYWGLFSDELKLYNGAYANIPLLQSYTNTLTEQSELFYWSNFYNTIYMANYAVEGLSKSSSLTEPIKRHLLGEAKFIRAFCYFYLINLYGDVPLILSTDYAENSIRSKSLSSEVYQQIIKDLSEAQVDLGPEYLDGSLRALSTERTRPSQWVASALLSRVYLYTNNYSKAILLATSIIENKLMFDTVEVDEVFKKDSREAIWQLQGVIPNLNTKDAYYLTLDDFGPNQTKAFMLSDQLVSEFSASDKRFSSWIKKIKVDGIEYYYPSKYKISTIGDPVGEYEVVFRLSEQYLIRSEAYIQVGKLQEGLKDLNTIRNRAGLKDIALESKESLLTSIYKERYQEFFTEWGHRWFDLKRTGLIDDVMKTVAGSKGTTWESYKQLLPIQRSELQTAPNLKQNPGYD